MAVVGELLPVEDDDDFEDSDDFGSEGFESDDELDELVEDSFAPDSLPARLSVR